MNQIPANWYSDPAGSGQLRYWDGTAWTEHLREPATPGFPPPAQPPPRVDPYAGPSAVRVTRAAAVGKRGATVGSAIALLVIGVLGLVGMSVFFDQFPGAKAPVAGSISATGTIVDFTTTREACFPIVEFSAGDRSYRIQAGVGEQPCTSSIGDVARLTYLPSSPASTARLESDGSNFVMVRIITWTIFGGAFAMGVATMVQSIKRIRRERHEQLAWER